VPSSLTRSADPTMLRSFVRSFLPGARGTSRSTRPLGELYPPVLSFLCLRVGFFFWPKRTCPKKSLVPLHDTSCGPDSVALCSGQHPLQYFLRALIVICVSPWLVYNRPPLAGVLI
jgi:hypothetical protein